MSESLPEPTKAANTLCGNAMESSKQDGEDRAAGVKQMHIDRPRNIFTNGTQQYGSLEILDARALVRGQ